MRYYKTIDNGYITAIGTGGGGTEITEREHHQIMTVILTKPPRTETTDYRLKTDLTWESYQRPPEPVVPDVPDNLNEVAEYLLQTNSVTIPTETEPDYLNEHEAEPNYFG